MITAYNMHPGGNVDLRTNLYFVQSEDRGATWRTAGGEVIDTPMTDSDNAALVHDYRADQRLVYLKDIGFDSQGNPVVLYVTSSHHLPGPHGDPRTWTVAHWKGNKWMIYEVTRSTHNYDMGSLYIEADRQWRIFAPTESGPQSNGTGGEIAIWASDDQGQTWKKARDITRNSPRNHGYVRRPVNARAEFYAFWADGNPDKMSESRLYFTDQAGSQVWCLPYNMESEFSLPSALSENQ